MFKLPPERNYQTEMLCFLIEHTLHLAIYEQFIRGFIFSDCFKPANQVKSYCTPRYQTNVYTFIITKYDLFVCLIV